MSTEQGGFLGRYDVFIVDMDGTLANSSGMWLNQYRQLFAEYGIEMTDAQIVQQIFGRYRPGMRELGFSEEELIRLGVMLDENGKESFADSNEVPMFPYARDVLAALRNRYPEKKVALWTVAWRVIVDAFLEAHGLHEFFDATLAGDEVEQDQQKPHRAGRDKIVSMLGLPIGSLALIVGDSSKDLEAARNTGDASLLFYPPEHELQHDLVHLQLYSPTYIIRSWQELINQLQ